MDCIVPWEEGAEHHTSKISNFSTSFESYKLWGTLSTSITDTFLHTQMRIDDEIYRETHCTGSHYSEKAKFDNKVTSVDTIEPGDGDSGGE